MSFCAFKFTSVVVYLEKKKKRTLCFTWLSFEGFIILTVMGDVGGSDGGFGFCLFVLFVGFVGLVLRAEKSMTSGKYSW